MLQNMSMNQTFKIIGECCLMILDSYALKAFLTVCIEEPFGIVKIPFYSCIYYNHILYMSVYNMDINFLREDFWKIKKMNYCVLKCLMSSVSEFLE